MFRCRIIHKLDKLKPDPDRFYRSSCTSVIRLNHTPPVRSADLDFSNDASQRTSCRAVAHVWNETYVTLIPLLTRHWVQLTIHLFYLSSELIDHQFCSRLNPLKWELLLSDRAASSRVVVAMVTYSLMYLGHRLRTIVYFFWENAVVRVWANTCPPTEPTLPVCSETQWWRDEWLCWRDNVLQLFHSLCFLCPFFFVNPRLHITALLNSLC